MYLCVLVVIFKNKQKEFIFITLSFVAVIVLCDQLSSGLIKPLVERLRPSHEPALNGLVHLVNGYTGGRFGFVSSHAANSFGFAMFSALVFRYKPYSFVIFVWALFNSYSRIYLGVHYPLDVICGAALGVFLALLVYILSNYIRKIYTGFNYKRLGNINVTVSGFGYKEIRQIIFFLLLTVVFISISAYENLKI